MARLRLGEVSQSSSSPRPFLCLGEANAPLNLGKLLLSLQLKNRDPAPRLELVVFLAGRRVRLVHLPRAELDEALDPPARRLAPDRQRQRERPRLVHLVVLRVARLAAAVEDVVPLGAVGAVEDPGEGLCGGLEKNHF